MFEIGGGIGTPIALDEATMKRSFGHFARILIEINLNLELRDKILVEREAYAFFVEIEYERLPSFCSSCQTIGHSNGNGKNSQIGEEKLIKGMDVVHKEVRKKVYAICSKNI